MKSRETFYARSSAMPKVFEVAKKKVCLIHQLLQRLQVR